jgi:hypothetical protein
LVSSTYLEGTIFDVDVGIGIAVDSAGDAYIVSSGSLHSEQAFVRQRNPASSVSAYFVSI